MQSQVGGHAPWELELSEASELEKKERLRNDKKFLVYRGSARAEALEDIRKILRSDITDYLKIWDPYFGVREAAEFLPYVFDPSTSIKVLTSLEVTPQERAVARSTASNSRRAADSSGRWFGQYVSARAMAISKPRVPPRTKKMQQLQTGINALRHPAPGAPGLGRLECRVGAGNFHDRFLITRGRCWQLGCSFNQIGRVMSTIVEFPYPFLIEREFDWAWDNTTEIL